MQARASWSKVWQVTPEGKTKGTGKGRLPGSPATTWRSSARSGIASWKQKSASAGLIREHLGQVWGIAPSPSKVDVGHECGSSCCTEPETVSASLKPGTDNSSCKAGYVPDE